MRSPPVVLLACGLAVLTACGNETPVEETGQEADRDAKGEVVGGTIRDDMIPLDRLRSQSPPVRAAQDSPQSEPTADSDDGEATEPET